MVKRFELTSDYQPAGDQPKAIEALVDNLEAGWLIKRYLGLLVQVKPLPWLTLSPRCSDQR